MTRPLEFFDLIHGPMKMEQYGPDAKPWLFYKHPDGQWVTLREATEDDLSRLHDAPRYVP